MFNLDMKLICSDRHRAPEITEALEIAKRRRENESSEQYDDQVEMIIMQLYKANYSYEIFKTHNAYESWIGNQKFTYHDELKIELIATGKMLKTQQEIKVITLLLGMITKKDEDRLSELIQRKWCQKYFHNDHTLTVSEMYREVERAGAHYRVNASAALFKRIKAHLQRTGRIEVGQLRADISTSNNADIREWLKQFGSIRTFHDISKHYDLAVKEIKMSFDQVYHRVKIVLKTKNHDDGYYGGCTTFRYENERIREERKIQLQKKNEEERK